MKLWVLALLPSAALAEPAVPVFLADVKGDLAGLSQPGQPNEKLQARLKQLGVRDWAGHANPVVFWDCLLYTSDAADE